MDSDYKIFRRSYFSAFSDIGSSKSRREKLIIIAILVTALTGFLYQFSIILSTYLAYPTIKEELISYPEDVEYPAITICNDNPQKRSIFCKLQKNIHVYPDSRSMCFIFPDSCPDNQEPNLMWCYNTSLEYQELARTEEIWNIVNTTRYTSDMIHSCYEVGDFGKRPCKAVETVAVTSNHYNFFDPIPEPAFCYIINSDIKNTKDKRDRIGKFSTIELTVSTEPHELRVPMHPIIHFSLHDRKKIVNPFSDGKRLLGGNKYEATVTNVVERTSMPSPYETNCTDYISIWRKNNGIGPLSYQDCFQYCIIKILKQEGKCISGLISYPHRERLCDRNAAFIPSKIQDHCREQCQSPCFERTYDILFEEKGKITCNSLPFEKVSEWCKISHLSIIIKFSNIRLSKISYVPQMQAIELMSSLGGCLGIWIGVSVIDMLDVLTSTVVALYNKFSCIKIEREKNKLKSLEVRRGMKVEDMSTNSILKKAYIQSVADAVLVESKIERFLKMLIFFLCLAGFIYHIIFYTKQYLSYETAMNEIISRPLEIERPAFTFCDSNTRNRIDVCTEYPSKCKFFASKDELCKKYFHYCHQKKDFLGVLNGSALCQDDCYDWKRVLKESVNFMECLNGSFTNCSNDAVTPVPFINNDGERTICYTYWSRADPWFHEKKINSATKTRRSPVYISTSQNFRFSSTLKTEEYLDPTAIPAIFLAVHDPRRLVNPFREGTKFQVQGQNYRIKILKVFEQKLLSAPYDTNCTDYESAWEENSGYGPLTEAECNEYCQFNILKKEGKCIPKHLGLSHTAPLCERGVLVPRNVIEFCITQCGVPCLQKHYLVLHELVSDIEAERADYQAIKEQNYLDRFNIFFTLSTTITFHVSFPSLQFTNITYEPKATLSDYFSEIGGYLGVWIGVSFISIMDIIRRIIYISILYVKKKMIKKTKTKKIFRRITAERITEI